MAQVRTRNCITADSLTCPLNTTPKVVHLVDKHNQLIATRRFFWHGGFRTWLEPCALKDLRNQSLHPYKVMSFDLPAGPEAAQKWLVIHNGIKELASRISELPVRFHPIIESVFGWYEVLRTECHQLTQIVQDHQAPCLRGHLSSQFRAAFLRIEAAAESLEEAMNKLETAITDRRRKLTAEQIAWLQDIFYRLSPGVLGFMLWVNLLRRDAIYSTAILN